MRHCDEQHEYDRYMIKVIEHSSGTREGCHEQKRTVIIKKIVDILIIETYRSIK